MARKPTYEELKQKIRELEKESAKRRNAETALRESEKKFRSLVEHLPETIVYTATLDAESTTTYVSPQVSNLLGYSQQDYGKDPSIWRVSLRLPSVYLLPARAAQTAIGWATFSEACLAPVIVDPRNGCVKTIVVGKFDQIVALSPIIEPNGVTGIDNR